MSVKITTDIKITVMISKKQYYGKRKEYIYGE